MPMNDLWNYFYEYILISYPRLLWVFLFACIIYLLFQVFSKKRSKKDMIFCGMLSLACSFVFVMTLFRRGPGRFEITLKPFWSYYTAYVLNNTELWLQIIMNIAMYIPIGCSLPGYFQGMRQWWKTTSVVLACSVVIEVIQYLFSIGYPDVDDVLNNIIGTLIGFGLYKIIEIIILKAKKGEPQ